MVKSKAAYDTIVRMSQAERRLTSMDVETKYALLKENIKNYGKIAVAYSGGLDSTFLLKVYIPVTEIWRLIFQGIEKVTSNHRL